MFVPLEACSLRTIIAFFFIVLAGAVQLRRWESVKPIGSTFCVFWQRIQWGNTILMPP